MKTLLALVIPAAGMLSALIGIAESPVGAALPLLLAGVGFWRFVLR